MLSRHIFLGFCGLAAGMFVAAGTFAFLIIIGVIPRMVGKTGQASEILHFENAVIGGGIFGTVVSVFPEIPVPLGSALLCVFGLAAGIFVGCIAIALAEILDTFPITFRRFHIKEGLSKAMLAMAFGKSVGSFFYFMSHYVAP